MTDWTWQSWGEKRYLTCTLLKSWQHGFFTREYWPQAPADLTDALQKNATVCRVKQVHGNTVLSGCEMQAHPQPQTLSPGDSLYPHADGLYSDAANQALWVCTADCTPVLIGDRATGHTAAVHAGWRGTAARIVPIAIEKLLKQGSQLADLQIAMGPAIAGDVYQVTEDVAQQMAQSLTAKTGETTIDALMKLPLPPLLADSEPGRVRLDVRRVNAIQLEELGVQPKHIAIAPQCTFQSPERFFSYRRDGLKKVQWSGIVSKATPKTAQ